MSKENLIEKLIREGYIRLGFPSDTLALIYTDKFLDDLVRANICRNCGNFVRLQSDAKRAGIPTYAHGLCKQKSLENTKYWVRNDSTCPEFRYPTVQREVINNDD